MAQITIYLGGGIGPQVITIPNQASDNTAANTVAGQTYAVQSSDRVVTMSTVGAGPTANQTSIGQLSPGAYPGERHTFVHNLWGTGNTPPQIVTSGCSATPIGGLVTSGTLVVAGTPQAMPLGGIVTAEWSGSFWLLF